MTVYTVFGQPTAGMPGLTSDTADYTFGMQFSLSANAALTGIWFWTPTGATVLPGACCIYQVTGTGTGSQVTGTVNTSPTWSGSAGSASWVKCTYPGTTTLTASTSYKVCVLKGFGTQMYGTTASYWSSAVTNGIITANSNATADGGQDTFTNPAAALVYPASSFNSSNYWIDVEVDDGVTPGGPTPSPLVVPSNAVMRSYLW